MNHNQFQTEPTYSRRQPCGTLTLDEDVVKKLEEAVGQTEELAEKKKVVTMQVRKSIVYLTSDT